jgi:nicotinamide mononucleotide (NMN) deamidase PncC
MDSARTGFLSAIHASGRKAVIAVTGGGSLAVSDLLTVPGASAFLLEARVPYSSLALTEWLGRAPDQSCSRETALAMSVVAYQRARHLSEDSEMAIGVGGTAALASDRPKRGEHRAWIATHTRNATRVVGLSLSKGLRDRAEEERLVADALLRLLSETCGLSVLPELPLQEGDSLISAGCVANPLLVDLVTGRRETLWVAPTAALVDIAMPVIWQAEPPLKPAGLLAGSFNPLHDGHRELIHVAEQRLNGLVACEMSCVNVDKPPLDFLTIESRCRQFTQRPIVVTHAPTFVLKSRLFPNTVFVVGIDTADRIVQPKYYGGEAEMLTALSEIRSHGCRFLVAGRFARNSFNTLRDLALPVPLRDLFEEISEAEFRCDLSSTKLRRQSS